MALVPEDTLRGAATVGRLSILPVEEVSGLPFDHDAILGKAVGRLRGKGAYSVLPARLLPPAFTMPGLRATYEAVMWVRVDPSSFRRKITDIGIVEEIPGDLQRSTDRPAQLYS